MQKAAYAIRPMLLAPAWSSVAATFGWMPRASETRAENRLWKLDVGYLVRTASTSPLSMPQSSIALRMASTVRLTALRPGSLPYAVWPIPAIEYFPLMSSIIVFGRFSSLGIGAGATAASDGLWAAG